MGRILALSIAALIVVCVALVAVTSPSLPDVVATHFTVDGRPNGWMSRGAYSWFMGGLALALPLVILFATTWLPASWPALVNVRFRDYWLAPMRRGATLAWLRMTGLAMAALAATLIGALHLFILDAHASAPPQLANGPILAMTAFFVVTVTALVVGTALHFRVPARKW